MSTTKGKEPVSDTPVTSTTTSHGNNNDHDSTMYIQLRYSPGGAAFDAIVEPQAPLSLASPAWLKRNHPKTLYYESKHTKYTSHVYLDICIPVRQTQSSPGGAHDSFVNLKQIFYVEGRLIADLALGRDFVMANQVLVDMDVPSVQFPNQNAIADARVFELPVQLAKPVVREARRVRFAGLNPASNPPSALPPVHEPVHGRAPGSGILKRVTTPDPDLAPASNLAPASDPISTSTQSSASDALERASPLTDAMRAAPSASSAGGDNFQGVFEFPPHKEGEDRPNPLGSHPGPALNGGMSWPEAPIPNPALEPLVPPKHASDVASIASDGSSPGSFQPQDQTLYSLPNHPLSTVRIPSPPKSLGDAGISLPTLVRATSDPALTHRQSAFTTPRPAPDAPIRKAFVDRGKVVVLTGDRPNESSTEGYRDTLYEVTEGAKGKGPLAPKPPKHDVKQDDGRKQETVINPHSKIDPALAGKIGAEEDIAKRVSKKF